MLTYTCCRVDGRQLSGHPSRQRRGLFDPSRRHQTVLACIGRLSIWVVARLLVGCVIRNRRPPVVSRRQLADEATCGISLGESVCSVLYVFLYQNGVPERI